MQRIFIVRVVAALLLLIAGTAVYACDVSDACVSATDGKDTGCDDPGGDACLCCCGHIVPGITITLQYGKFVRLEKPTELAAHVLTAAFPIYHPPQA